MGDAAAVGEMSGVGEAGIGVGGGACVGAGSVGGADGAPWQAEIRRMSPMRRIFFMALFITQKPSA